MAKSHETLREDVQLKDIFLDLSYGRVPRKPHIDKLVREWDRSLVGAIYLSMRSDGKYASLDGYHRISACRIVEGEDASLPARVYIDLTVPEEAKHFIAFNRDRDITLPGQHFKARLIAGERDVIEINNIVESLGFTLDLDSTGGHAGENTLNAISSIEQVYRANGANGLREVLLTLRNTMGTGEGAIQASTIKALAKFYARYFVHKNFDKARLYKILSTHSTAQLKGLTHAIRASSPAIDGISAMGMAMLTLFNKGLSPSKQLPAWQARVFGEEAISRLREVGNRNKANLQNQGDRVVA